jgi:hypothetical protein
MRSTSRGEVGVKRSYTDDWQNPTRNEIWLSTGYFAICYRGEGEDFYVAVVYHARYVVPGPLPSGPGKEWWEEVKK